MPAAQMLEMIADYPVEDKVMFAEAIISSLNGIEPEIDAAWGRVAKTRLAQLKSGKVRGVSGATVFARSHAFGRGFGNLIGDLGEV